MGLAFTHAVLVVVLLVACSNDDSAPRDAGSDASDGSTPTGDAAANMDSSGEAGVLPKDASLDALTRVDAGNGSCDDHHDCMPEWFCHRGACRFEADNPIYHCGAAPCPPGHWCVEADGRRGTCAEDLTYRCENACDCGPAHCCIDEDADPSTPKRCVRDFEDPLFRGSPTPGAGASCRVGRAGAAGRTPTYCSRGLSCFPALTAWLRDSSRDAAFLAYDEQKGEAVSSCATSQTCFGTACGCDPGRQCVSPTQLGLLPGTTCGVAGVLIDCDEQEQTVFNVGACSSNAIAESVYNWAPGDLLSCCDEACVPGDTCDLTWIVRGDRYRHERVTATCLAAEDCECGDGVCCPSELRDCPQDCLPGQPECGDGVCDPFERTRTCPADCPQGCSDGLCIGDETVETCPADCREVCGDGYCSVDEKVDASCPADCSGSCAAYPSRTFSVCGDLYCDGEINLTPCLGSEDSGGESCLSCPSDCGKCLGTQSCSPSC